MLHGLSKTLLKYPVPVINIITVITGTGYLRSVLLRPCNIYILDENS
jgi:hypothetical protein